MLTKKELREQIEAYCMTLGLDCIGFVPYRKYSELSHFYETRQKANLQNEFEEQIIEKRIDPSSYLDKVKTVISIAFPYNDLAIDLANDKGFSVYTQRLDYHQVVEKYLKKITQLIETLGGEAIGLVDSNSLPERYIACLAGVGFIGRNNMLITKKYGSYVFLGEILMTLDVGAMEQTTFEAMQKYTQCGKCNRCYRECPTQSITAQSINPNVCLSYLTQKKHLEPYEVQKLKGHLFGCDLCQLSCPHNSNVAISPLEEFKRLNYMQEEPRVYAEMDNAYFKEKIRVTSCGWRGKNVIKRNAILAMHHDGQSVQHLKGDSPYINTYIEHLEGVKKEEDE